MGNEFVTGGDTFELDGCLLQTAVNLGKEEPESTIGGDAEKGTLSRMRVKWAMGWISLVVVPVFRLASGGRTMNKVELLEEGYVRMPTETGV